MTYRCIRVPRARALAVALVAGLLAGASGAQEFTPNHLFVGAYSVANDGAAVFEFDEAGAYVRTLVVTTGDSSFLYGVAFGPDGNLYAANQADGRIFRITPDGSSTVFSDSEGDLSGGAGLAFGPNGNLYVASRGSAELIVLDTSGLLLDELAGVGAEVPDGIAFGPDGMLLLSNDTDPKIAILDPELNRVGTIGEGDFNDYLGNPAFAPDGRIVVSDYSANTVDVFSPLGTFQQSLSDASVTGPYGLAFGPDGRLYVADFDSNAVAVFTLDEGFQTTFTHEDMTSPAFLAFAPFRYKTKVKGDLLGDGQPTSKAKDVKATLSVAPGSGTILLALDEDGALASPLVSTWQVFHGFEAGDDNGKRLLVNGTQLSRSLGAARVASIELLLKGKTGSDGFFSVQNAKGTLHWTSAMQLYSASVQTSKLLK